MELDNMFVNPYWYIKVYYLWIINYAYHIYSDLGTHSFRPDLLSAHFNFMDCYRSIAHFVDFQVRSLLNGSKKNQWFALGKER